MSVKRLSDGYFVLGGENEAALISLQSPAEPDEPANRYDLPIPVYPRGQSGKLWARWFNYPYPTNYPYSNYPYSNYPYSNNYPYATNFWEIDHEPEILLDLVKNNNLQMPLLNTNVDFVIGNGVGTFKKNVINGKTSLEPYSIPAVDAWMTNNQVDLIMMQLATDYYYVGNYFLEGILQGDQTINSIKHHHPTNVRASLLDKETGNIEYYFVGDFRYVGQPKFDPNHPNDPELSTVKRIRSFDRKSLDYKFIWHGKQYFPGEYYYGIPWWYGVKDWIRLANKIPIFHLAGLTKGYLIRWHIKIPISYFEQFPENERANEEEKIMTELDAMLSGAENAGKAFVSRFSDEKNYPEWKIEPLQADLYDDAYKDIFEHSNTALSSANNIDPTLAGYDITGKLSSGSEKRNSYLIHLALKTPRPRKILLKWLYDVRDINGWPLDMVFAFKDIEITTLDINPTGTKNTVQSG